MISGLSRLKRYEWAAQPMIRQSLDRIPVLTKKMSNQQVKNKLKSRSEVTRKLKHPDLISGVTRAAGNTE